MRFTLVLLLAVFGYASAQQRNVRILGVSQTSPQPFRFQQPQQYRFQQPQQYRVQPIQYRPAVEPSRYQHDKNGQYYHQYHDDSGRYVHDNSGKYVHDHSGIYTGTVDPYNGGFGRYSGTVDPYAHERNANFGKTAVVKDSSSQLGPGNEIGAAATIDGSVRVKQVPQIRPTTIQPPATRSYFDEGGWRIIRQEGGVNGDGYHYLYETENGINAEEEGHLVNRGTDHEGMEAKGFFSYTGPDNVLYHVSYTADADGFHPEGAHIHPIPPLILRSLEYKRSLGLI